MPNTAKHPTAAFAGYHQFVSYGAIERGEHDKVYGSFEVFYNGTGNEQKHVDEIGWYWWPCFPGCLPDGDPVGQFPTAEGAYLDVIGE
ncbi:MAG TPA: hypothetical protein VFR24_27590 [Candidatus Angelobacter sp.]|nr:hypothetical protein [Candidatus Angelobacter sp.]